MVLDTGISGIPPLPDACTTCGIGKTVAGNVRKLADQALKAQEKERARLARELHDETGQALTLLLVRLRLLEEVAREPAARAEIGELRDLVGETLDGVRRLAIAFGSSELDQLGLVAALDSLIARVARETGKRIDVDLARPKAEPARPVSLALYRVAQEALTNAIRHAHAQRIDVRLRTDGATLSLEIDDDGVGFDTTGAIEGSGEGSGILGMAERMALAGGSFSLESRPGEGTRVIARVTVPGRSS